MLIGTGSHGDVYRVDHPRYGQTAIKKLRYRDQAELDDILDEVQLLEQLRTSLCQPFVVKIYEHKIKSDIKEVQILMEYLQDRDDLFYDDSDVMIIGLKLLHAVKCLHNLGIVHRDIARVNIVIMDDLSVRLIDFGDSCNRSNCQFDILGRDPPPEFDDEEIYQHKTVTELFEAYQLADFWAVGDILRSIRSGSSPQLDSLISSLTLEIPYERQDELKRLNLM